MKRREFLKYALSGTLLSAAVPGLLVPRRWVHATPVYDAVIIGGGLSGLTAAAAMKDSNILILEREPEMGGRIVSREWEGFSYSLGASYIGKPDGDMRSFLKEIGVQSKPFPVPPPQDALALGGTIFPDAYSDQVFGSLKEIRDYVRVSRELYRLAGKGIDEAVYGVDLKKLDQFKSLDSETVAQWLERHDVGPIVQQYINTENRGLFGSSNADLSLLYNIPEMAFNLYDGSWMPTKFERRDIPDFKTYTPRRESGSDGVWTFTHGMSEMIWAIERQAKLQGKLKTGAEVQRVAVKDDKTVQIEYRRQGRTEQVMAHTAVLATPAPVTAAVVQSGLSSQVMTALQQVHYVPYVTMGVFLKKRLFRNSWNISCLDTVFSTLNDAIRTRVDYEYNGKSVLGVAMPSRDARDTSLITDSDDQLFGRVIRDVERYFPGVTTQIIGRYIHRFRYGFPVFAPGYTRILNALHRDPSTRGPLILAGDYTVYPTMGGAAISGERAAAQVERYFEKSG